MNVPLTQVLYQTIPLERPFGWGVESFTTKRQITFFPSGTNLTISFSTNRFSKFLAICPLIGTIIGISRVYKSIQEYRLFTSTHLHSLSNRSIKWGIRGALETIPVLGGLVCFVVDIALTILNNNSHRLLPLPDETSCGSCHVCGYCRC